MEKEFVRCAQEGWTSLDFSRRKLLLVPQEVGRLTKLTQLWLFDNQIASVSGAIGGLVNLKELDISFNQIKELPEEFTKLTTLQKLLLGHNDLRDIPEGCKNFTTLEELDISWTRCKAMPNPVSSMAALVRLDLSHNEIGFFPDVKRLTHLQCLDLGHNNISTVLAGEVTGLTALRRLNLAHNNFYEKPTIETQAVVTLTGNPFLGGVSKSKSRKIQSTDTNNSSKTADGKNLEPLQTSDSFTSPIDSGEKKGCCVIL